MLYDFLLKLRLIMYIIITQFLYKGTHETVDIPCKTIRSGCKLKSRLVTLTFSKELSA